LKPDLLEFICFYKLSQDHIELFFGAIRFHGGYNDNPTVRQFRSAYRKLLINVKIKDGPLGNSIPLNEINILNCSSAVKDAIKDPIDIINDSNFRYCLSYSMIKTITAKIFGYFLFGCKQVRS